MSCSLPRDPEELEIAKEDPQTIAITEDNNSIMSFFKTLVSRFVPFPLNSIAQRFCYSKNNAHLRVIVLNDTAGTLENSGKMCFERKLLQQAFREGDFRNGNHGYPNSITLGYIVVELYCNWMVIDHENNWRTLPQVLNPSEHLTGTWPIKR